MHWGTIYIRRFLRLLPTYIFAIFALWAFTAYLNNGPIWYDIIKAHEDCADYWWTNLLFINNFIPSDDGNSCLVGSWYLANDIQFFIITPPLIYLYYLYSQRAGWSILGALVAICWVITIAIAGAGGYNIVPFADGNEGLMT